jgi:hypothetical protein
MVSLFAISASFAAVYALEIGSYKIDLSIIDRILGIKKLTAEEQNINKNLEYRGNEFCKRCHAAEYDLWMNSKHNVTNADVDCEVCHGPARTEAIDSSREACGSCHGDIPYRPDVVAKIDLNEHFTGVKCIECHNPHNPWPAKAILYGK